MDTNTHKDTEHKISHSEKKVVYAKKESGGGQPTLDEFGTSQNMCWVSRVHCVLFPQLNQILTLKEHRVQPLGLRHNEPKGFGSFSVVQMFYEPYFPELDESGASVGP